MVDAEHVKELAEENGYDQSDIDEWVGIVQTGQLLLNALHPDDGFDGETQAVIDDIYTAIVEASTIEDEYPEPYDDYLPYLAMGAAPDTSDD